MIISPLLTVLISLHACAQAPAPPSQPHLSRSETISGAIQRVKADNLGVGVVDASYYIHLIADNNAAEGISPLEELFHRSKDTDIKVEVAIGLVKLHDKDDAYWNFLESRATQALTSDAPFFSSDAPGATTEGLSAEFIAWASGHNMTTDAAVRLVSENIDKIAALAKTGDPRGIPLLRQGLTAPNTMVQGLAVAGLAQAHDNASVPAIIALIQKSTSFNAEIFSEDLMFFDDREAIRVFKLHHPDTDIIAARKYRHNQPFASFALDQ